MVQVKWQSIKGRRKNGTNIKARKNSILMLNLPKPPTSTIKPKPPQPEY